MKILAFLILTTAATLGRDRDLVTDYINDYYGSNCRQPQVIIIEVNVPERDTVYGF